MNVEQAAQLLPKIRDTLANAAPEWSVTVDQKTGMRIILTRESAAFPAIAVAKLAAHPPFDDAELIVNAYRNVSALITLLDRRGQQKSLRQAPSQLRHPR
ncbi:hypothetical protein NAC44_20740 [Allorhizobium sp. BGMRC 0089]|uniref:hypothetical protein n=1 Tax=Allorhizobium sonneratiae TaxID=2934936 RepID=UPI002033D582|nr:hypothetical protein [Allorhizobium sonneratiae]MCM2294758.1 hypothetical protein [Allorhizobium sonneratiae]